MATLHVTSKSFNTDVIAGSAKKPVLVDFWAEWCGPCRMVAPILEEISDEYSTITIAKVNSDENLDIASRYNITSIPTMILFVDGEPVKQMVGAKPKRAILQDLAQYL